MRRIDGTFQFEGAGRHADYGPLRLTLDGRIERPRLAVRLERPVDSLGLRDVLLNLEPNPVGYAWRAEGGSTLGPFNGNGNIALPAGQPAIIQVAALNVSGTRATGALRADPGGFTGRLTVAGGGLEGDARCSTRSAATSGSASTSPPTRRISSARRRSWCGAARSTGVVLLDPAGTIVEGRIVARGVSRGPLSIANLDAQANLRGGVGQARIRIAGSRGRDFSFNAVADIAPGRYRVSGSGTLDRRPLELVTPAELTSTRRGLAAGADPVALRRRQRQPRRPVRHPHRDRRPAPGDAARRCSTSAIPSSASAASPRAASATARPRPARRRPARRICASAA